MEQGKKVSILQIVDIPLSEHANNQPSVYPVAVFTHTQSTIEPPTPASNATRNPYDADTCYRKRLHTTLRVYGGRACIDGHRSPLGRPFTLCVLECAAAVHRPYLPVSTLP